MRILHNRLHHGHRSKCYILLHRCNFRSSQAYIQADLWVITYTDLSDTYNRIHHYCRHQRDMLHHKLHSGYGIQRNLVRKSHNLVHPCHRASCYILPDIGDRRSCVVDKELGSHNRFYHFRRLTRSDMLHYRCHRRPCSSNNLLRIPRVDILHFRKGISS